MDFRKLMELISHKRFEINYYWYDIATAMVKTDNYNLFLEFSLNHGKSEDECEKYLNLVNRKQYSNITILTICEFIKNDSPDEYEKFINDKVLEICSRRLCIQTMCEILYYNIFLKFVVIHNNTYQFLNGMLIFDAMDYELKKSIILILRSNISFCRFNNNINEIVNRLKHMLKREKIHNSYMYCWKNGIVTTNNSKNTKIVSVEPKFENFIFSSMTIPFIPLKNENPEVTNYINSIFPDEITRIENLRKLSKLFLHPQNGNILSIIGERNSGKSSLVKIIKYIFGGNIRDFNFEDRYIPKSNILLIDCNNDGNQSISKIEKKHCIILPNIKLENLECDEILLTSYFKHNIEIEMMIGNISFLTSFTQLLI